jgi:hypothetical protein
MTDARVEKVYTDRIRAHEFLSQADRFRGDANTPDLSAESQSVLLHNAVICACDAILQAIGLRVTSGDNAHALRLETALEHLEGDTEELLESLDASRERRNEASYAAAFVSETSLADAREATTELLERVRAFLGGAEAVSE